MRTAVLYLGDDPAMLQSLTAWWQTHHNRVVEVYPGAELSPDGPGAVVDITAALAESLSAAEWLCIDARSPLAMSALSELAADRPDFQFPSRTLVVYESGFPLHVADTLVQLAAVRLRLPATPDEFARALDISVHQTSSGWRTRYPACELRGTTVRFSTRTPSLFPVLDQLRLVAAHHVPLLIIGETGTGKSTLAQLVHELSTRRNERFTTVACGALPADLIESELFGHVRGAFTGAERDKQGRFAIATDGTLLLDEIDVLSPREQTRLLRVIESGEYEPVGSSQTCSTDCRLIAASNVDLRQLTERGRFRTDLYYRLNVLEFHLPPLRERPLDLVPLSIGFISEFCAMHRIDVQAVEPELLDMIRAYAWPGNIRELKNHVRRAVLFARGGLLAANMNTLHSGVLTPEPIARPPLAGPHAQPREWRVTSEILPSRIADRGSVVTPPVTTPTDITSLSDQVADREREILLAALRLHNFKRTAAARSLGISRVGLYKKMRKHGLMSAGPADSDVHTPAS